MGGVVWPFDTTWELPLAEQTLPELLGSADPPWSSALAGKWHLSSNVSDYGSELPLAQGFGWFAGSMNNLWVDSENQSGGNGFFHFEKVMEDGRVENVSAYATTDTTNDAVQLLRDLPEPFLLVVSYNAAHNPWHTPPTALHSYGNTELSRVDKHLAATEALDTELGRLMEAMTPGLADRTWVVVVGDNGTPGSVTTEPSDPHRAKGSVYEGGVRVPMVVRGPGVPAGEVSDAFVHVVDLLPTVADIAGVNVADHPGAGPIDGVSQLDVWLGEAVSVRRYLFVEDLTPTGPGDWTEATAALRSQDFKLVRDQDGNDEFYDLRTQSWTDGMDLLADVGGGPLEEDAALAYAELAEALDARLADLETR